MILNLEIIQNCNLKCSFCIASKDIELPFLRFDEIVEIVRKYDRRTITHVVITGGEPMIHPEIVRILEYFKSLEIRIMVMTNGTIINKELLDVLKFTNTKLHISLDSISSDYHEIHRGSRDITLKNIIEFSRKKLVDAICMTVSSQNIDQIEEIFVFCNRIGVKLNLNAIVTNNKKLELGLENIDYFKKVTDDWSSFNQINYLKRKLILDILENGPKQIKGCPCSLENNYYNARGDRILCWGKNEVLKDVPAEICVADLHCLGYMF